MKLSSGLRHLVAMMAALFLGGEVAGGGLWARVWRHEGFQAFSQGSFEDSGSNIYVSRRGRIQLINRLDLNRDGHIDLFVANGHGHSEDEDAYVYLNNGETIDPLQRIALPTNGAVEGLVADLDRDGVNDLVVVNGTGGTTSKSHSFVYYGAEGRFPVSKRRQLRSWAGKEAAVGDWNRDGWPDLAIACANAGRDEQSSHSVVYWNSAHGFDPDRRTPLAGPGTAVLAADLAGDEALDLVLAAGPSVFVYAAGKDGLDLEKPLVLDVEARHLGAGDLDRDGRIELFVAVESEVQVRAAPSDGFQVLQRLPVENPWQLAVQDLNRDGLPDLAVTSSDHGGNGYTDSLVFWNRNGRLSETDPTPLATVHARGISAGDLDGDGWPELVVSNNHSFNDLNVQSFVFWNREGKFLPAHKSMLDTRSAHGNGIGDVDNDGHPDVIFFNLEGGLRTGHNPNFIYWGDGTRNYSTRRRSQLWAGYTVGTAQADLDDDGWVDLVSAEARYALGRPVTLNGVYVWYGGVDGYEPRRRAVLSVEDPEMGAVTADLNRDGYLDLVIGAAERDAKGRPGYVILYGAENGFSPARREVIPYRWPGFSPSAGRLEPRRVSGPGGGLRQAGCAPGLRVRGRISGETSPVDLPGKSPLPGDRRLRLRRLVGPGGAGQRLSPQQGRGDLDLLRIRGRFPFEGGPAVTAHVGPRPQRGRLRPGRIPGPFRAQLLQQHRQKRPLLPLLGKRLRVRSGPPPGTARGLGDRLPGRRFRRRRLDRHLPAQSQAGRKPGSSRGSHPAHDPVGPLLERAGRVFPPGTDLASHRGTPRSDDPGPGEHLHSGVGRDLCLSAAPIRGRRPSRLHRMGCGDSLGNHDRASDSNCRGQGFLAGCALDGHLGSGQLVPGAGTDFRKRILGLLAPIPGSARDSQWRSQPASDPGRSQIPVAAGVADGDRGS